MGGEELVSQEMLVNSEAHIKLEEGVLENQFLLQS